MLSININKLRSEVEAREQRKIKIYEKVLDLCYQRILNSNQKHDDYSCTYIVPNVVFGLHLYDVNECVTFIMNKLIEKDFEIVLAYPTTIHISWKPIYKYSQKHNSYSNSNRIEYGSNNQKGKSNQYKYKSLGLDLDSSTQNKELQGQQKHYKPIDEYSQAQSLIYDPDDINLFQSKLDHIFT